MNQRQQRTVRVTALLVFLLLTAAIGWFVGVPMIRLVKEPEQFRGWVDARGGWGRMLFVCMVALQVVIAFIPGEPVELAAGYAFGFWEGSGLTLLGFLLGSAVVFSLVRRFGIRLVEVFFHRDQIRNLRFLQDPKKTKALAFLLMLIPGTPKDILSYFAGLTCLRMREWLLIVAVGRSPSLISSVLAGDAAGLQQYDISLITLGVTAVISIIGLWYYRKLCKAQK